MNNDETILIKEQNPCHSSQNICKFSHFQYQKLVKPQNAWTLSGKA